MKDCRKKASTLCRITAIIVIIAVIGIIITCYIYSSGGYCITWHTSIDNEGTSTFVSILSLIIIPTITLVSVLLYYGTLLEQREQNRLLSLQDFNARWQNLITQQINIRDNTEIAIPVLDKGQPTYYQLKGMLCLKGLWVTFERLSKAIETNFDYSDWERYEFESEGAFEKIPEWLEHYEPEEYEKCCKEIYAQKQVAYIGYKFNIKGNGDLEICPQQKAFKLLYERYFLLSSTYFKHICAMLLFLQQNEALYKDQITDSVTILKQNLCQAELLLIKQYAEYDENNKELIYHYFATKSE